LPSAYIEFKDKLPERLKEVLSGDKRIECSESGICSSDWKYNAIFPEIVDAAIKCAYYDSEKETVNNVQL